MIFQNRYDAATRLIPFLEKYKHEKGIVLAIPRGGVAIGYHIAKRFHFPIELLMTKKIGHPLHKELAIGAVSLEGRVVDPRFNDQDSYIEAETRRLRQNLDERYKKLAGNQQPMNLKDRIVIIVDDGVATGSTILASIEMIRHKSPKKIVVAVPVASDVAAVKINQEADEFICLEIPRDFTAVSQFYSDFAEVDDADVIEMLNDIREYPKAA